MTPDTTTPPDELMLIDLSSLAHPIWHVSQAEPDANATSQKVVARVRALTQHHPHAAICCDSGRSFRKDIAESYKANRPATDAALRHQVTLACEQLQADGFPVWSAPGFEADDLIASAVAKALEIENTHVLVVSADKDLLQLVSPRVRQMKPDSGDIIDEAGVLEKFGVKPTQIGDFLVLVGDSSDNVKGANGIGPKKAAELLATFGSLQGIYETLAVHGTKFKPATASSLREFSSRIEVTKQLIALRYDVPVPFEEITAERVSKDAEAFVEGDDDMDADPMDAPAPVANASIHAVTSEAAAPQSTTDAAPSVPNGGGSGHVESTLDPSRELRPLGSMALTTQSHFGAPEIVTGYNLALDPRSMGDARQLAVDMFKSRLFSAYGTPQGVLATVMLGRELGLPAMASLRQIHIIEGKQSLSAQLMVALILKSGLAEFFEPVEFDEQHAIWETKRRGARREMRIEHTIEMAQRAGLVKDKSGWVKNPTDMLNSRAPSRLARLIYPDIVGGLYTPEELEDMRAEMREARVA